jgi:hypothetical protein
MRRSLPWLVAVALALPALATAKLNRSYLVPVYVACPGSGNCFPAVRASTYTFDSIALYSSAQAYTAAGKLALMVVVKGLKDASGAPVTGTLKLRVPRSRITILTQSIGTLGETSPLVPETVYDVPVQNGATPKHGARFDTPDSTPESGLVVNTFAAPILFDPDGNELASTGTQTKP